MCSFKVSWHRSITSSLLSFIVCPLQPLTTSCIHQPWTWNGHRIQITRRRFYAPSMIPLSQTKTWSKQILENQIDPHIRKNEDNKNQNSLPLEKLSKISIYLTKTISNNDDVTKKLWSQCRAGSHDGGWRGPVGSSTNWAVRNLASLIEGAPVGVAPYLPLQQNPINTPLHRITWKSHAIDGAVSNLICGQLWTTTIVWNTRKPQGPMTWILSRNEESWIWNELTITTIRFVFVICLEFLWTRMGLLCSSLHCTSSSQNSLKEQ
jgi:hypothetical protein